MSAENIGKPSSTFNPSPTGVPRTVISHPGASGAQLTGELIQLPHPNQH